MKKTFAFQGLLIMFACLASIICFAQVETRTVKFPTGQSSTSISSTIKGYKVIDYAVSAKKGQTLSVSLITKNGANYFNLLPPGSNDVADYNGSLNGNTFSGQLSSTGVWKIRVYLERSEARRNVTASFKLKISVAGN